MTDGRTHEGRGCTAFTERVAMVECSSARTPLRCQAKYNANLHQTSSGNRCALGTRTQRSASGDSWLRGGFPCTGGAACPFVPHACGRERSPLHLPVSIVSRRRQQQREVCRPRKDGSSALRCDEGDSSQVDRPSASTTRRPWRPAESTSESEMQGRIAGRGARAKSLTRANHNRDHHPIRSPCMGVSHPLAISLISGTSLPGSGKTDPARAH